MNDWRQHLEHLRLASPWWLLAAAVLLPVVVRATRRAPPTLLVPTVEPFARALGKRRRTPGTHLPLALEVLAILCFVVALARPQLGGEQTVERTRGIDIILALDVSGSMQVVDLPEAEHLSRYERDRRLQARRDRTRIHVAKEEVDTFIDHRPHDRIGLIAFAAHAYTACPPTLDHTFLKRHLTRLDAGMLHDANTGIAAPVAAAVSRLKESAAKRRVLVLFTDGDNNIEARITPHQAADLAHMFHIVIYTVGIGSTQGYIETRDFFGRSLWKSAPDSLNEDLLGDLAGVTGGRYFVAKDADGLARAMADIDALETIEIEQTRYDDYRDLFPAWLLAGLVLMMLAFIAEHTVSLKVP